MSSILLPPAAAGGAGATNILGTWLDPDKPYSFGTLAAINDPTGGVDHLGESGLFHNAQRNFNIATFIAAITDALGGYSIYQSGATATNDAYAASAGAHITAQPGADMLVKFRTDPAIATLGGLWLGFFQDAPGIVLQAGNPGTNHAGLHFQASGNANFQFFSRGNTGQEGTNSLVVAANDTVYYFRLQVRQSEVTFTLYDSTFSVVAGPIVHTTQFPQGNTKMFATCYSWTETAADRDLQLYFCHIAQRQVA